MLWRLVIFEKKKQKAQDALWCRAYLYFFEDEFVPHAVLPHHTAFKLSLLPPEGEIEQPSLQRRVGLTEHLWRIKSRHIFYSTSEKAEESWNKHTVDQVTRLCALSDLIKHAVEETRDHGEDCRLQRFQIIHQKPNVPLEITDSSPVDEDDALRKRVNLLKWNHFVHQGAVLVVNSYPVFVIEARCCSPHHTTRFLLSFEAPTPQQQDFSCLNVTINMCFFVFFLLNQMNQTSQRHQYSIFTKKPCWYKTAQNNQTSDEHTRK